MTRTRRKKLELFKPRHIEVPKPKPAPAPKPKPLAFAPVRDEVSTGRGSAIRRRGLELIGSNVSDEAGSRSGAPASSLRTEVKGDGLANCLENAVDLAKPGDDIVLLTDSEDAVGHAVVERADGQIVDPNRPESPYESLEAFTEENPRYSDPVTVSDDDAERLLAAQPGLERDEVITELGLDDVADREVADPRPRAPSEEGASEIEETARTEGPAAALSQLHTLVEDHADDPTYVRRLLEETQPLVTGALRSSFGAAVSAPDDTGRPDGNPMLGQLASISAMVGPEASAPLGEAIAQFQGYELENITEQLKGRLPSSLNLTTATAAALGRAGRTDEAAGELGDVAAEGLSALRGDFEGAAEEVTALNEELGYLVSQYGPALPPEDLDRAIASFKEEHAEEYARFEETGAALSVHLEGAAAILAEGGGVASEDLREEAAEVMELLPEIGQTRAGQQEIAAGLIDQGEGRPSFLDGLEDFAGTLDEEEREEWLQGASDAIVRSVGVGAAAFARGEGLDQASPLFRGLAKNAGVLGIDPHHLEEVTEGFEELAEAHGPTAVDEATRSLGIKLDAASELKPDTALGQSLRGLGTVLGAFASITTAEDFADADLALQVKYSAETLNVGVGGAKIVFEALEGATSVAESSRLANLASGAGKVLGPAGALLTAVAAVADGITAVDAFKHGEYVHGAAASANALGGAALAISSVLLATGAGSQTVPVVGTIVGSVLIATGFGIGLFHRSEESNHYEEDAQHFLEEAGVDGDIAHELRNADPSGRGAGLLFQDVAEKLEVTPRQFFDWLRRLPAEDVKEIVEAAHSVIPNDGDEWRQTHRDDAIAGDERGGAIVAAQSVTGFTRWLETQGYEIPGATYPDV